jgi:hypothetical protein
MTLQFRRCDWCGWQWVFLPSPRLTESPGHVRKPSPTASARSESPLPVHTLACPHDSWTQTPIPDRPLRFHSLPARNRPKHPVESPPFPGRGPKTSLISDSTTLSCLTYGRVPLRVWSLDVGPYKRGYLEAGDVSAVYTCSGCKVQYGTGMTAKDTSTGADCVPQLSDPKGPDH